MKNIIMNFLYGIGVFLLAILFAAITVGLVILIYLIPYGLEIFLGLLLIFGIYKLGQFIRENIR